MTEQKPPKIPRTASTSGKTIARVIVQIQKPVQIMMLAEVVRVLLPVTSVYKFILKGIVSSKHLTISMSMTAPTAMI